MAIVIVAPETDLHGNWIEWGLKESGFEVIRWAGLGWRPEDSATIRWGNGEEVYLGAYKLSSKDTVWLRRPRLTTHPGVSPIEKKFATNEYEAFQRNLLLHIERTGARCVNKWSSVLAIESKSLQLSIARECGLRVPATTIGNSAEFVKSFLFGSGGDAVHKAFRPHAWVAASGLVYNCETTRLRGDCDWPDETFAYAPGIYQQRVEKRYDVRINMIGRRFHSFVIATPGLALDWRSHGLSNDLQVEPTTLPQAVESALCAFSDRADLLFGCFDMVVDAQGDWWFLEVNQAGQFLWIDDLDPDYGLYHPMLEFLTASEPVSNRPFPSFRQCRAECKSKTGCVPLDPDFPFRTVEGAASASGVS